MKAVILAGGYGTRISEETSLRPKPLIEIGGKPILWHIMKIYEAHGIDEFVICCGFKGYMIKEYFVNYFLHQSDIEVDLASNETHVKQLSSEAWRVTLVDTGEDTMTGGRLKRAKRYLEEGEPFCFTYGDGVADVDIKKLVAFHQEHQNLATVTAVQPPGRYGALKLTGSQVNGFAEKPKGDGGWINGGFFVLDPKVIDYIADDATAWESEPLAAIAAEGQLEAFFHSGFWQPMDTLGEKTHLETLWESGSAPWKVW